jgi:uncharacterized protein DUF5666
MILKRVSLLIATAALVLGAIALPAQAALRHIDGTVGSKNASNHTFRLTTQSGNTVRVKVTSSTKFQRLAGFGALHKGLRVEVDAKTTSDGLVATQVETRGGGGGGGADDTGGDDHGGGGGGADDGPNHT